MAAHPYDGTGLLPWRDATVSTEHFPMPDFFQALIPDDAVHQVTKTVSLA